MRRFSMLFKKISLLALAILMVVSLVGCGEEDEEVVATVNGEELLRKDFEGVLNHTKEMYEMYGMEIDEDDDEMMEMIEEQAINELITETLLLQEAENEGITVDEEVVEQQIEAIEEEFETEEEMEEMLAMANLDADDLENEIRDSIKIEELVDTLVDEDELEVTDEELEEIYEEQMAMQQGQEGIDEEELPELEEMKPQLEEMAKQQKMQKRTGTVIEELREDSDIEILL
ncbi:SurA N-terminal domain-containing protein [Natranaerobius trueperi]|nr:SurA N-terminal domain-containing protein [Natranaerobius trueperi]